MSDFLGEKIILTIPAIVLVVMMIAVLRRIWPAVRDGSYGLAWFYRACFAIMATNLLVIFSVVAMMWIEDMR